MRIFLILLVALFSSIAAAGEDLRSGTPKDCYLYSWGKGPDWTTKISAEFRLSLLNRQMPYIDENAGKPTEKALAWIDRQKEPVVTTLATVEGRKVIQVVYPEQGSFGKTIGVIILAIETGRDSEWFSPFFCAQPELYRGQFVSGKDVAFGYVATLEAHGTGSLRTHFIYDLRQPHPVIVSSLSLGRVTLNQFKNEEDYEEALKIYDKEADLMAGIIPKTKEAKQSVIGQDGQAQPAARSEPE